MHEDLVSVRLKTTFTKFISVFKDFIELPSEISGFSDNERVYKVSDGVGNPAFLVQRAGDDTVHSFGAILIDKVRLSLLTAA